MMLDSLIKKINIKLPFIKTHHWHYGIIVVVLVVVGIILLWLGCWAPGPYKDVRRESFTLVGRPSDPEIRLVENYTKKIISLKDELMPYLDKALTPEDRQPLDNIHKQLVVVPVPNEARSFHIKIVLKLAYLVDSLSRTSSDNVEVWQAKVTKAQTDLRDLIIQSPQISLSGQ